MPLKISLSFWSKFSSSSARSNLQQGHMPANANMKDAVHVPGQRLGKRGKDNFFCLKLMLSHLVVFFTLPQKEYFFIIQMKISMICILIHDIINDLSVYLAKPHMSLTYP